LIGKEACGSAYHWARKLQESDHTVRLTAPQFVKPEMLWRHFRREVTYCELFSSLDALLEAARGFLDRYNQRARTNGKKVSFEYRRGPHPA
jgi:hypothetical protein